MADISTPAPIRRLNLPLLSFPRPAIGTTLNAIFAVMGDAFKMAYLAPYTGPRRQPQVAPDDDLEGRDPSW